MAATPAAQSGAHLALPSGIGLEALLVELRRLSWGAADILRAELAKAGAPDSIAVACAGPSYVSARRVAAELPGMVHPVLRRRHGRV